MKILIPYLIIFNIYGLDLKVGDILLQPLNCMLCNLIESQTDSIYSHVGIYIGEGQVAEAFIKVRSLPLNEFLSKTQKKEQVKVLRPKFNVGKLQEIFKEKFNDLSYDSEFLWSNFDEKGELIYCSELVYKMLSPISSFIPTPQPMKYDVNYDLWFKYFKGNVPTGKIGISPAMFDDEYFFDLVGFL